MPRLSRFALLPSFLVLFSLSPSANAGGAVLTPLETPALSVVDVRMAVAVTPSGSTRWSELTLPPQTRALWLVPIRPGATIEWVSSRWLDALDEATRPRITPPSSAAACPMRTTPETPPVWTFVTTNQHASSGTVEPSADAVLSYATTHGYRTSPALRDALAAAYAEGWRVLRLDVTADAAATAFGTVRVTDDGGAVLPLAITSGMRLTTFTLGQAPSVLADAQEIERSEITWGLLASNYAAVRHDLLASPSYEAWIRESYSHDAIFDGVRLDTNMTPSIAGSYFVDSSCTQAAETLSASTSPLDPSTLSCGEQTDLALALAGTSPAKAVVTRWVSSIPAKTFGSNAALGFDGAGSRGPVLRAGTYESCRDERPPSSSSGSGPVYSTPSSTAGGGDDDDDGVYIVSEGCGSSGSVATSDPPPPESGSSSEGCSGSDDTSGWDDSDSDDDDDGWDSDDSSDSCSGTDDSSSSSSDSCSSSSPKKSGSDDGWDTEDNASPKSRAAHKPHKRRSSPASRYALLAVAILLPFRRRARPT